MSSKQERRKVDLSSTSEFSGPADEEWTVNWVEKVVTTSRTMNLAPVFCVVLRLPPSTESREGCAEEYYFTTCHMWTHWRTQKMILKTLCTPHVGVSWCFWGQNSKSAWCGRCEWIKFTWSSQNDLSLLCVLVCGWRQDMEWEWGIKNLIQDQLHWINHVWYNTTLYSYEFFLLIDWESILTHIPNKADREEETFLAVSLSNCINTNCIYQ